MARLETIEGIGPHYAARLREAGVRSTDALLAAGGTARGRQELAQKTGIGDEYILDWVNRSDLMRVRGIGEEYSDLLEWAGVDTTVELGQRNAQQLHSKLLEVNAAKRLVRRPPSLKMVADWIVQARSLPRAISY